MARYDYSSAARLEAVETVRPVRHVRPRPQFEVVEGAGLDARARAGVGEEILAKIQLVVVTAAVLMGLGAVRVGLCSQTVSALQQTASLRSEIKQAQALEDELKVEHSVMYSSVRIEKIATQNYGMVQATEAETISVMPEVTEEAYSADESLLEQGMLSFVESEAQADETLTAEAGQTETQG